MPFQPHPSVDQVLAGGAPATDKAYRAVLDAVASGTTAPGELLSEGDVAAALGLSRTPVHAACVRLAAEGLLTLHPKRGLVVTAVGDREARDLLETRLMVEGTAVRWLVDRGLPTGLEQALRAHLAEQRDVADDDALAFARADRALHEAVVTAAGNTVTSALFAQTGPRLLRLIHRAGATPDARRRFAAEHAGLVDLLLAGDADGYSAALDAHVLEGHRVA